MYASTILSWMLATAPETSTPTAETREIASVDFRGSDDAVQITARDSDGEVSAEVFVWSDGDGRTRFDAAWPDGAYVSVVTDGKTVTVDSDDQQQAVARVSEMRDVMMQMDPQAGKVPCVAAVVSGIFHAVHANPFVVVDAVLAACECLPLLVDEWKDYHCPGFG